MVSYELFISPNVLVEGFVITTHVYLHWELFFSTGQILCTIPWGNSRRFDKYKPRYPDKSKATKISEYCKKQSYPLINLHITLILIRIVISLHAKQACGDEWGVSESPWMAISPQWVQKHYRWTVMTTNIYLRLHATVWGFIHAEAQILNQ